MGWVPPISDRERRPLVDARPFRGVLGTVLPRKGLLDLTTLSQPPAPPIIHIASRTTSGVAREYKHTRGAKLYVADDSCNRFWKAQCAPRPTVLCRFEFPVVGCKCAFRAFQWFSNNGNTPARTRSRDVIWSASRGVRSWQRRSASST